MSLVVTRAFHLNGVLKNVGEVLTKAEEEAVRLEQELLDRCVHALHEIDLVVQAAEESLAADEAKLKKK